MLKRRQSKKAKLLEDYPFPQAKDLSTQTKVNFIANYKSMLSKQKKMTRFMGYSSVITSIPPSVLIFTEMGYPVDFVPLQLGYCVLSTVLICTPYC